MKILLSLLVLTLFFFTSTAQSSIELLSDFGIMNNRINEPLLSGSYGFLDTREKNEIISALRRHNGLQIEANNSLNYQNKNGWSLTLSNQIAAYANYSKNLVQLTLLGNSPFKGHKLDLSPLDITAYHYSKLEFGYLLNSKFKSSIAFITGHQMANLELIKGDFYTHQNADYIEYDLNFQSHYTDTSKLWSNPFEINGIGAAFSFSYSDTIPNGSIAFNAKDIGFIAWNEKTKHTMVQSQWKFEGIDVSDFVAFNDSLIQNEFDSIQNIFKSVNQEEYIWRIPPTLEMYIYQKSCSKIFDAYSLTLMHKLGIYTKIRMAFNLHKSVKKHHFTLGYHLGGFERNGFQIAYHLKGKKTHIQLFSKQANSIDPLRNYGLHIGIGIKRVFSKL